MPQFAVIIAAAGKAERFGRSENKIFAKLDGRPVFLRVIELFMGREDVCQTILAVAPEDVEAMKSGYGPNLGFMGVKLVEGGAQRSDTVAAAMAALVDEADYVAVHDAARPCATDKLVDAVFAEAVKTGAAIPAAPITGTIKRVDESNIIQETVPRSGLYEAQTPQVFRRDVLVAAYEKAGAAAAELTDDAQIVERSGHAVSVVISDFTNLKLTTKPDMALANAILKARPIKKAPRLSAFEEAQW